MKKLIFVIPVLILLSLIYKPSGTSAAVNTDSAKVCIVTGEALDDNSISYIYLNKTVELCCEVCVKAFNKEPAKYLKGNLWCSICDDDDAVKEISAVHNKVKYYFCNESCRETFNSNPEEVLNKYSVK
ncbi:MAG TPA: hypothetical protein PK536_13620 [Ignavibacteria bacterium]|nr:hypothetical protein [Bacteroidota bacterium]HRI86476.1 hypothetical protein [Ignavibacteria bacterium]HRK00340.1 hypothetical protein [Ignavibacteria bacterium]